MVSKLEHEHIEVLVNDCIIKKSYDAAMAWTDLNAYLSKLRKEYQENIKDVGT